MIMNIWIPPDGVMGSRQLKRSRALWITLFKTFKKIFWIFWKIVRPLCYAMSIPTNERNTMSDTELIKDLFEGVIDDNALAKLSKEELDAINKMLTEAGY
jgi:hypothetical protein